MKSRVGQFIAVALSCTLAACGEGESQSQDPYVISFASYDDYSKPVETYTPPVNTVSFFPLAIHFRTITKSYVSKVGTSSIREYSISGSMTTPTVKSGTYDAKQTTTVKYLSSAVFEGYSVIPITYDNLKYQVKLNNTAQPDESYSSTSFSDTTYGLRVGSRGTGYYKVLDLPSSKSLPEIAFVGDTGDFLVYKVYSDSSKATLIGRDVLSFKILTTSLGTAGEYKANVAYITSSYSPQGQLLGVQTSTDDVAYSVTAGAASKNLSLYVDDVVGTTTSRLLYTRLK